MVSFYSLLSFGQKKELYVNDNFDHISKAEFNKKYSESLYYNLRIKSDSSYLNVKVSRSKKGRIELKILFSIKNIFYNNKSEEFSEKNLFLINYYPGKDNCSTNGYKLNFKTKHNQYRNKFEKVENLKQLFIYKTNRGLRGFGNEMDWQPDINNLIESTFFPIHYPCGGFVVIDNKGNYISGRGEYCYWEGLLNGIKTFANNGYK